MKRKMGSWFPVLALLGMLAILLIPSAVVKAAIDPGTNFDVAVWEADVDKLPESAVVSMTLSHRGYLWLGTLDGLVRFDGTRFVTFKQSNTPGLRDNQIIHLFEDSRSNLWIGTASDGIYSINREGVVEKINFRRKEDRLASVCEDSSGAIWLYGENGSLMRLLQGKREEWQVPASNCRAMAAEKNGLVWIGTDKKIYGINPFGDFTADKLPTEKTITIAENDSQLTLQFLLAGKKEGLWIIGGGMIRKLVNGQPVVDLGAYPSSKPAVSACEDLAGNLVVGTYGDGIWWFDAPGNPKHLTGASVHLSHDYILSLVMDDDGSLWVGTNGGGLNRVKRQPFAVLAGTAALTVQSVAVDLENTLWLNTRDGVRHLTNGTLATYREAGGILNLNGQSIFVDGSGSVWAGYVGSANGKGLYKLDRSTDHFEPVNLPRDRLDIAAIFQDHASNLWVGTQLGLAKFDGSNWMMFTDADGLSSGNIQAIAEDSNGIVWIGTTAGLNSFKDGKFSAIHSTNGLPGENVSSILIDSNNVMWVGTLGTGLGRFENGSWTHYSSVNGLLNDTLTYLLEDGLGDLWIGSRGDVLRLHKEELNRFARRETNSYSCKAYGKESGLGAGECTAGSQPAACRTPDGNLWFPTIKGLATVDPAQLRPNTNAPPVVIESVSVADQLVNTNLLAMDLPETITVPAGKRGIEINYTSLNLGSADHAKFRYRMEGFEPWHSVGQFRVANYPELPPGHYTFRVIAGNEDDVWNMVGASIGFIIEPPFWRTWWFLVTTVLVLTGLIAGIVYYLSTQRLQNQLEGLRQQQAVEKERARIARDIHDQLGASMTQISLLGEMVESDKNEPAEVEQHAQQITQAARDTSRVLDEIVWTVNPSNDTIEGLINYLCKYAQEYFAVAGVRYRLDVPPHLPETGISPEVRHNVFLAAKESITNVVKHAKATEVWVRLKLSPGSFTLEVQDNGREPINLSGKETRNGLRNMRRRLEDVGGTFELVPAPEGGAIARLTVPVKI